MPNNIFRGLPSKAYTDKSFWAKENKNVFSKNWVFVGFAHELKNVGDVLPINVADQPVLLIKESKDKINAFHNVCSHRCLKLVEKEKNVGQIIRTAECAGINGIVFPSHNSFRVSNTIINVSQGAFLNMPLYEVTNVSNTILDLKKNDHWVIGIENSIEAKLWSQLDYTGHIAIVVGSEGKGIRKKVIGHCDFLGNIPMQGDVNSLNVSAAVSAILFERLRQIKFK